MHDCQYPRHHYPKFHQKHAKQKKNLLVSSLYSAEVLQQHAKTNQEHSPQAEEYISCHTILQQYVISNQSQVAQTSKTSFQVSTVFWLTAHKMYQSKYNHQKKHVIILFHTFLIYYHQPI